MDKQLLKQRIIGALVLIALAVLILPIILEDREPEMLRQSAIPPRPEPEPFGDFEPRQPVWAQEEVPEVWTPEAPIEESPAAPEPAPRPAAEAADEAAPAPAERAGLDADGLPRGWVVQLGTFSQQGNAERLVQRLREAGYHAYSKSHRSVSGKALERVYVGPVLLPEQAEALRAELEKGFKMRGIVADYVP